MTKQGIIRTVAACLCAVIMGFSLSLHFSVMTSHVSKTWQLPKCQASAFKIEVHKSVGNVTLTASIFYIQTMKPAHLAIIVIMKNIISDEIYY